MQEQQRDGSETEAPYGRKQAFFFHQQSECHAENELEHDRLAPERDRHRHGWREAPECYEAEQQGRDRQNRPLALQQQRAREDNVEEHFIIKRPTERINRMDHAVRQRVGDEQIGCQDLSPARRIPIERRWNQLADNKVDGDDDPIDRYDACDATGEKDAWAVDGREEIPRCMDHDEAGDDEEHVHTRRPGQEVTGLIGQAEAGGQ